VLYGIRHCVLYIITNWQGQQSPQGGAKTMRKMNALMVLLVGVFCIVATGCDNDRSPLGPTRGCTPTPTPTTPGCTPTTPTCVYAVQESPQNFSYQGGNGGFSVGTSDPSCPWTATATIRGGSASPTVPWVRRSRAHRGPETAA